MSFLKSLWSAFRFVPQLSNKAMEDKRAQERRELRFETESSDSKLSVGLVKIRADCKHGRCYCLEVCACILSFSSFFFFLVFLLDALEEQNFSLVAFLKREI